MFMDSVFDGDGTGGDSVAKDLNYDRGGAAVSAVDVDLYDYLWLPARDSPFVGTNPFNPSALSDVNNLFVDETADNGKPSPKTGGGFRGELLLFTDFNPGKTTSFSGDMDPNSIAGYNKGTVDDGATDSWDVGGISGSEMVHGVRWLPRHGPQSSIGSKEVTQARSCGT